MNWIEVTERKTGEKCGVNFNNFDILNSDGRKGSCFKKIFFENMAVRPVAFEVLESYEEVKRKISGASNDGCYIEQVNQSVELEQVNPKSSYALKTKKAKK